MIHRAIFLADDLVAVSVHTEQSLEIPTRRES